MSPEEIETSGRSASAGTSGRCESTPLHAGLAAFIDRKDHVDAAVRQIDDAIFDARRSAAGTAVDFEDALDIGIDESGIERPTRARLNLGLQAFGLDLAVALEGNAVDDIVFSNIDDDRAALAAGADTGEQTCLAQVLNALVDVVTGEVGANGVGIDAAIAVDHD